MTVSANFPVVSLGYEPVDHDHHNFVALIEALNQADNVAFPTLFSRLLAHTEQHFELENQLMQSSGFPAHGEHRSEHQRVLGEFNQFKLRVDKGLVAFGRSFLRDRVVPWFKLHVVTMDSALIAHLHSQQGQQQLKHAGMR